MKGRRNTCRRKPFSLKRKSVKRSPFRTLESLRRTKKRFARGSPIGFTARSSLKSMGLIPREDGCYVLGKKYQP